MKGGKAHGRPDYEFNRRQLQLGTEIEMEHTDDPEQAKGFAKDHLAEYPDYYTHLVNMERKLEAKQKKKGRNWKKIFVEALK